MTVTEIETITKGRYKVVLDAEVSFVLYKGELRRFRIKPGADLPEEVYQSILRDILPKRARLRCLNLLKTKAYTQKQMEDKLTQGGYPAEVIEDAIAYAASYGYINDRAYTRDYIEYHVQTRSWRRIENDLLQKGIRKDLIRQTFEELSREGIEVDEISLMQEIFLKKNYHSETATLAERRKMYSFLYRKGFHADAISRALLLDIT